jgi:hypothetical protein
VDVAKSDPTKLEARSPQPGRSGFLNSKGASAAGGPASGIEGGAPGRPEAPAGKGLAAPLGQRSLAGLFSSMGLSLHPSKMGVVQDRVMAALSLIASRSAPSTAPGQERAALGSQERAAAIYRRAQASFATESGHAGRARGLAILEGLFAGAGLDLDAEGLAALSSDSEGGGSGGGASGGEASGSTGQGGANAESGEGYEASANLSGQGKPSPDAPSGPGDADEDELGAFERMAKGFFASSGEGPNDWQAFNERARALDPGWCLVPFGFTAGNVEFSGYFRVLCHKGQRAVLSLGADFRSNGHFYSFTLRGSELSLEGPELMRAESLRAVQELAKALEGQGLGLSYSGFSEAERGQGAWA